MALFNKLFGWAKQRQRERPSARQEARQRAGKSIEERLAARKAIERQVRERAHGASADWKEREQQRIAERIAQDRAAGRVPTGIFESDEDVSPFQTVGSTGSSIVDPSQTGDPVNKETADEFLDGSLTLFVDSSNVEFFQYFPADQIIHVGFIAKGGSPASVYGYSPITRDEAMLFVIASSKGSACWDYLRVRGSATLHRKNYWRIS